MRSTWAVKQPFGSLFKFLVTLFIVVAIPTVLLTVWVNETLNPVSVRGEEKVFVIKKGEGTASFSQRLKEENLIKNVFVFRVYLKLTGLDQRIQAGSFKLSPDQSVKEISLLLTTGRLDKWVTIVEGLRKEEIAQVLAENFEIDKKKFLKAAQEGELFPDTYLIPVGADEKKILSILEDNFDEKFSDDLKAKAANNNLTQKEVLIVASIVEREARSDKERPIIAGILIKRWREGMQLAADATVQYALGFNEEEKSWWRKNLTEEDLKVDSPYNTRIKIGLPPDPICNPGLSSINSVVEPVDSSYYFYLHDEDGNAHYAKTFGEHQQNIEKYLSP